jgi:diguanylate cyclase (GGDEF)-like protein
MKILVMHHNGDTLAAIKTSLESNGFGDILAVGNTQQALDQLKQQHARGTCNIDVALLDILPPDMEGYELCRTMRLHDEWADIPVIMIIAGDIWHEEIAKNSFETGATDILSQSIHPSELVPRVLSALSLKKERDLRKHREQELEAELAERKVMEARLQYLVEHDDLTGLYNRRRLEQELETAVSQAKNSGQVSALLYIDLDQFKVVNDTEGHTAGDRLLLKVSNTLRRLIDPHAILAHISSDEFAILLPKTGEAEALKLAEGLRRAMDENRYSFNNRAYHIGVSIGIAMIRPNEQVNASEILARADQACYIAKTHGRNIVYLFNHEDIETLTVRSALYWVPQIRNALAKNKFQLAFQPVMDLHNQTINRYEVLLRLIDSNNQIIQPDNFIPVAEYIGLIHDIDLWVVNHAMDMLDGLLQGYEPTFNINLSSHAFQDTAMTRLVEEKLNSTRVKPSQITFEITETAAVSNFTQSRNMITQLRGLGCRFALDDFGAGFNSFNYIKQFPVDYLKIDGAFITNLLNDKVDQTLVESMVKIARTLHKQTVAEFVENSEVLELLKVYGVDFAQGYYIGPPGEIPLPVPQQQNREMRIQDG